MVSHGWGAIHGASTASAMMVATMTRPALSCIGQGRRPRAAGTSGNAASIADSRVEPGIEEVGDEVGQRIDTGHHQDRGLQRGDVARLHGEDQQAAEAWIGEYRLDD